jgi:hypothetical protein
VVPSEIRVTRPDNAPSRRMMERIGLICEGRQAFRAAEAVWCALDRATRERSQAAELSTRG